MKAPNLPSFRPSRPSAQDGQTRGIGAVVAVGEEMRAELVVERVDAPR